MFTSSFAFSRLLLTTGFLSAVTLPRLSMAAVANPVDVQVDWPRFVGRHDLTFTRLPDRWDKGAFLGNGRMGAMLYQEAGVLLFELGDAGITDFQPPRPDAPGRVTPMSTRPRMPIGKLTLQPRDTILSGTVRLDLWNAELTAQIKTTRGELRTITCTLPKKIATASIICRWRYRPSTKSRPRTPITICRFCAGV